MFKISLVKNSRAVNETLSQSYGMPLDIHRDTSVT